jgi:hypothetical protein
MNTDEQVIEGTTPPQAENWGDPNALSLMDAMDKFFEQEAGGEVPQPPPTQPSPETPPVETPPATPDKPSDVLVNDLPDLPDDFFPDASETPVEAKEEPKTEAFDEVAFDKQTEEEVKGMDAKAGEKFRALKAELKEAKKTTITPDVKAKLQELEIKAAEVDGLKERMIELSSQSARLQMENEEVYQNEVLKPVANLFEDADSLSTRVEVDPNVLRSIIKERDLSVQEALIEEHFGAKSLLIQSKVADMVIKFNTLVSKRDEMLANAETKIEKLRAERVETEKKVLREQRLAVQTIQKQLWEEHKELIPGLIDDDGNETEMYKKLVSRGLSIDFGMARAKDQARAALSGTVLPFALKQIRELEIRLSAYEQDDKKKVRKSPAAGTSVSATPAVPKAPKDFMDAMAQDYQFTH